MISAECADSFPQSRSAMNRGEKKGGIDFAYPAQNRQAYGIRNAQTLRPCVAA